MGAVFVPADLPDSEFPAAGAVCSCRAMRPLWRDLILRVWGADPLQCPCCKFTMRVVDTFFRPGEIEFFLRLHGLWEGIIDIPPPPDPPFDIETINAGMKLNQTLLAMTIAGGLGLAGEAKANIIYNVNEAIGAGGVVGTLTTDGKIGVIGASDILSWNFTVTGNGGATLNLVNGPSGVAVGNNTAVFNPTAGTPDLTADANHIFFKLQRDRRRLHGFPNPAVFHWRALLECRC